MSGYDLVHRQSTLDAPLVGPESEADLPALDPQDRLGNQELQRRLLDAGSEDERDALLDQAWGEWTDADAAIDADREVDDAFIEEARQFRRDLYDPEYVPEEHGMSIPEEDPCWVGSLPEAGHDGPYLCAGPGRFEASAYTRLDEDGSRTDVGRVAAELGVIDGPYGGTRLGSRTALQALRGCDADIVEGPGDASPGACLDVGTAYGEASLGTDGATAQILGNAVGGTVSTDCRSTPLSGSDTCLSGGVAWSSGAGIRIRHSDQDADGVYERGGGLTVGPAELDLASER